MISQFYIFFLIFIGVLSVTLGDMIMAQRHESSFVNALWLPLVLNIVGVVILLVCYYYGYKNMKSIWQVSIFYVCTIAVMQPVVAYLVLENIPTVKQTAGFLFGVVGILLTI